MSINDAIVVIDGAWRGWVGYFQGGAEEASRSNWCRVRLFASDGEPSEQDLPLDYIRNVEPEECSDG